MVVGCSWSVSTGCLKTCLVVWGWWSELEVERVTRQRYVLQIEVLEYSVSPVWRQKPTISNFKQRECLTSNVDTLQSSFITLQPSSSFPSLLPLSHFPHLLPFSPLFFFPIPHLSSFFPPLFLIVSLGKALHPTWPGDCPCPYCKSLWIRVSAKCNVTPPLPEHAHSTTDSVCVCVSVISGERLL